MWRPDNWEEIKPGAPDSDPYDDYCNGYDAGAEDGADAMLEGLKKIGVKTDAKEGWYKASFYCPNKGFIVFVPDE